MKYFNALLLGLVFATVCVSAHNSSSQPDTSKKTEVVLSASMKKIIARYNEQTASIIRQARADSVLYNRLATVCDTYGSRLSGSDALEKAIDWVAMEMQKDGFDTVYTESVMVPHWVRGTESAELLIPRRKNIAMLGLGGSIPTPADGISGEVLVVGSFDELKQRAADAKGKIVLFNVPFTRYGETVQYRVNGAIEAGRVGAVASLVRSVGPASLYTPHTGAMHYNDSVVKIPHAAISVEDAEMLQRMQDRGQKPFVRLTMRCQTFPDSPSRNVIAEIRGSEKPEEVVVFGGHIDSWDVGQGAMDDGGGCFAAWHALRALKTLGLRPKRTLRAVCWTNEENGLKGGNKYAENRANDIDKHVFAIESDEGTFAPQGFEVEGGDSSRAVVREICSLLSAIGATTVEKGFAGADVSPLTAKGVPGAGLKVDDSKYFWYHHTNADTMDKLNPDELNRCAAALGVLGFIVADLPFRMPK